MLTAMFLPFNVLGLFLLDVNSISRYAVGYAAMYALLAADGIAVVAALTPIAALIEISVILLIAIRLVWWTLPALREVRRTSSPPSSAMAWIREHVPRPGPVYVHRVMEPFSILFLPDYRVVTIDDPAELPLGTFRRSDWFVAEGATAVAGGKNFVRERGRLFNIARQRYFEVSLVPLTGLVRFGAGWYGRESVGASEWRWMSRHSQTFLPPLAGKARLTLAFDIPSELVSRHPAIDIQLNGQLIEHFVVTSPSTKKSWVVAPRADDWNELVMSMDKVLNPAREGLTPDARDLGLDLTSYGWGPAGGS
ncbi:MAG: hypothetical protein NVSMB68_05430 [Thermoanaerobaculia bacterium]